MANPVYRIGQEFIKIEATGTRGAKHADPADPVWLNVRVTPSDDIEKVIESVIAGKDAESNKKLYKIQTGLWVFELTPGFYEVGKGYTCHFRFEMTPNNMNVVRKSFTWQPVPEQPHLPENCVIHGILQDVTGVPVSDQRLVIEQYKNFITLNHRTGQNTVTSDAFGNWMLELPRKALVRVVFGNITKVIEIPDKDRAALNEIPDFQPAASQRDKFGYPFPGV